MVELKKNLSSVLTVLLIVAIMFDPIIVFAETFDENTNRPIRNLFKDINSENIIRLEIEKANSALTVIVENRDVITNILGVLQSVKMEEPFPYKIDRDNSGGIGVSLATGGNHISFNGEYDYHLKIIDQSGRSQYAYMSSDFYGFFYLNGRVAQFGTSKSPDTFYSLLSDIDVHLMGQPVVLDFASEGWPDKLYDDKGVRQIDSVMVGISRLAYKKVSRDRDIAELTQLTRNLKITSGERFLSASAFKGDEYSDLTKAITVVTFTPPNVARTPYVDWYKFTQQYHLLYDNSDGRYYLGYFDYMDLPIEKSSAEKLLRFVKELNYAEKSDELFPGWWGRASNGM